MSDISCKICQTGHSHGKFAWLVQGSDHQHSKTKYKSIITTFRVQIHRKSGFTYLWSYTLIKDIVKNCCEEHVFKSGLSTTSKETYESGGFIKKKPPCDTPVIEKSKHAMLSVYELSILLWQYSIINLWLSMNERVLNK